MNQEYKWDLLRAELVCHLVQCSDVFLAYSGADRYSRVDEGKSLELF